jgi:hypothetical protein
MAKVKIQGNASGAGVLTVTAPNTATDRTITLPDATGTLLMTDGDGSSLSGLSHTPEGTAVVSTGETGATKFLREDGDGTCSWQAAAAGSDISVDSWHLSLNSTTDVSSNSDIDFSTTQHLGSNLSEAGGVITVGTAGMYLVSYSAVCPAAPTRGFDLNLYLNGTLIDSTYIHSNADSYSGWGVTVNLQLAATDTIKVKGTGHFYGNPQAMSRFIGTRIGD